MGYLPKEIAQKLTGILNELEAKFTIEQEARKQAEVDCAAFTEALETMLKYDSVAWLHPYIEHLLLINHSRPILLTELKQHKKALEIACEELTEGKGCPYVRDIFDKQDNPYRNDKCDTCLEVYGENPPITECYIDYFLREAEKIG